MGDSQERANRSGGSGQSKGVAAVRDFLEKLPPRAADSVKHGFAALAELPAKHVQRVFAVIAENGGRPPTKEQVTSLNAELNLPPTQFIGLLSGLGMISFLSADAGLDEIISALVSEGLLSGEARADAEAKLRPAWESEGPRIRTSLNVEEAANRVLPNLNRTTWTVDLRPFFHEGRVEGYAPVAVVHFDTDLDPALLCQLSRSQLDQLLKTFEEIRDRMDLLTRLSGDLPRG